MAGVDVAPQSLVRPWLRRNHEPGVDVGIPRRYHLGGLNAFQLLSPTALGGPADYFGDDNYWETVCSIGLVPLVLAVVAALRHPDRRLVRGWLVLAAASVVFACGESVGLYSLCFATVPGVGLIRVPARSLFLANLAGAVLAGLGLETLRIRMADLVAWRRLARRFGVVALIVIGLSVRRSIAAGWPAVRPSSVQDEPSRRRSPTVAPGVRTDGPRRVARARRRALLVRDGRHCPSCSSSDAVRSASGAAAPSSGLFGLVALGELGWYGCALIVVAPAERFVGPDPISAALVRLGAETD